jgi:hypothetical protein
MTAADAFALPRSDLNTFLFAEVCVESSGVKLSVLSTLARAGLDPWQEARRLSVLPRVAAVASMEQRLLDVGRGAWPAVDNAAMAARLVNLLPPRFSVTALVPAGSTRRRGLTLLNTAIVLAVLGGGFALRTWSLGARSQHLVAGSDCATGSTQFAALGPDGSGNLPGAARCTRGAAR